MHDDREQPVFRRSSTLDDLVGARNVLERSPSPRPGPVPAEGGVAARNLVVSGVVGGALLFGGLLGATIALNVIETDGFLEIPTLAGVFLFLAGLGTIILTISIVGLSVVAMLRLAGR